MKKTILRISALLLAMILMLTGLAACGGGIPKKDAIATTESLLNYLSIGDFEAAAALYHPDTNVNAQNLSDYCADLLDKYGIDVSLGMGVEAYTGFGSSLYDSTVGGSRYELTMKVAIGDKTYSFTSEVIKNEQGYGINRFSYNH